MPDLNSIARMRPVKPPQVFAAAGPIEWSATFSNATGYTTPPAFRSRLMRRVKALAKLLGPGVAIRLGEEIPGWVTEIVDYASGWCLGILQRRSAIN